MMSGKPTSFLTRIAMAFALALLPASAMATTTAPPPLPPASQDVAAQTEAAPAAGDTAAASEEAAAVDTASAYTPMTPTQGKGMPVDRGITFQDQYSENGAYALWMHDYILLPVITVISLFVLVLMLWVMTRYRRRAGVEPSKTSHNTTIEIIWTVLPALILIGIAVPSISLIRAQYAPPPADAITIKAVGVQWHWEYELPDHGISLISKMLNEPGEPVVNNGVRELGSEPWDGPGQLEVDNRLVVPVGVPLRIQTTANDVIHSFAVPSLWFKMDAVPGRINERVMQVDEPGVYYGQCSELCGTKHAYMPIAIEAVPMERWRAWVRANGGTFPGEGEAGQTATETAEEETSPATAEEASEGSPSAPASSVPADAAARQPVAATR